MILSQTAIVKWNSKNKKKLVDAGYIFSKMGDEVEIKLEHLAKSSLSEITLKCDYCGCIYTNSYQKYNYKKSHSVVNKDCCVDCLQLKAKDGVQIKHGVNNPFQSEIIREKAKKTNIEKYGVENPFQREDIKEKIVETNLKKYGVKSYKQTEECQEKFEQTCLLKYGEANHMKTDEYREMFKGDKSPVWKGGVKHHRDERVTFEYNQWRKNVFYRDNHTCQCCGIRGGTYFQAHHIYNWKDNPDKRYEVDNGISMCQECHTLFHSTYGKKHNTPEQLKEFIENHDKNICQTIAN